MNHRYVALALLAASLLLIGAGYALYHAPVSQDTFYGVASPMYLHTRWLPPLFLLLIFVDRGEFLSWFKLFVPLAVIAVLAVVAAEPVSQGFFPGFPDRPHMTEYATRFVVFASLAFIGARYLGRTRRP